MRLLFTALLSVSLYAAAIRGTVAENQTGRPVARTTVELQPLPGTAGQTLSVRTNRFGIFEFGSVAPGSYVLKASKRGFMPAEYGQKRWNAAGTPVAVRAEETATVALRLLRYSAISGTVGDENEVGLPDYEVLVYRVGQPPQIAANGRSDERGVFRVSGLEPGAYLVRSAARQDADEEYLPTFSKETAQADQASIVPVDTEEEARGADVRVLPGKPYSISGMALTVPPGIPVRVTLASEMGRQTVESPEFRFTGLPPGPYELFAEAPENPGLNSRAQAAYTRVPLDGDVTNLRLPLQEVRDSRFDIEPSQARDWSALQLQARRKDLAGTGPPERLRLSSGRAKLAPGRWELSLTPPAGYYVSGFSGPGVNPSLVSAPDGWNEILVGSFTSVRFSLSDGGGGLRGTVKAAGESVAGAPVYLEAYDATNRKRLSDLKTARTDPRGVYQFQDLAPGSYRVLATFEYRDPDPAAMEAARAQSVRIDSRGQAQMNLDLFTLP